MAIDVRLTDPVTDLALIELGLPEETLDQKFRRVQADLGPVDWSASIDHDRFTGRRTLERGRETGLTVGETYALWLVAQLEAIDADHDAALDQALADLREGRITQGHEFAAAMAPHHRRRTRRRTAATKLAYGITYTQFLNRKTVTR